MLLISMPKSAITVSQIHLPSKYILKGRGRGKEIILWYFNKLSEPTAQTASFYSRKGGGIDGTKLHEIVLKKRYINI